MRGSQVSDRIGRWASHDRLTCPVPVLLTKKSRTMNIERAAKSRQVPASREGRGDVGVDEGDVPGNHCRDEGAFRGGADHLPIYDAVVLRHFPRRVLRVLVLRILARFRPRHPRRTSVVFVRGARRDLVRARQVVFRQGREVQDVVVAVLGAGRRRRPAGRRRSRRGPGGTGSARRGAGSGRPALPRWSGAPAPGRAGARGCSPCSESTGA